MGAKHLAKNTTLTTLHLSGNRIGNAGTKRLVEGLKNNKNLLSYAGPGHKALAEHTANNRAAALRLIERLTQAPSEPITPEQRQEIQARSNAIGYLLDESADIPPERKDAVKTRLNQIALAEKTGWTDKVSAPAAIPLRVR